VAELRTNVHGPVADQHAPRIADELVQGAKGEARGECRPGELMDERGGSVASKSS
jgi:hypothetical protein